MDEPWWDEADEPQDATADDAPWFSDGVGVPDGDDLAGLSETVVEGGIQ